MQTVEVRVLNFERHPEGELTLELSEDPSVARACGLQLAPSDATKEGTGLQQEPLQQLTLQRPYRQSFAWLGLLLLAKKKGS